MPGAAPPHQPTERADRAGVSAVVVALVVLTVGTGVADAVTWNLLRGFLAGNISGELLSLAFDADKRGTVLVPLLGVTASFALGVAVSAAVVRQGRGKVPSQSIVVQCCAVTLLAGLVVARALEGNPRMAGSADIVAVCLVSLAIGLQAAAVRPAGVTDLNTVTLTSTFISLIADGPLSGGRDPLLGRRLAGVLALPLGLCGGLAWDRAFGHAPTLALATALLGLGTCLLDRARRFFPDAQHLTSAP